MNDDDAEAMTEAIGPMPTAEFMARVRAAVAYSYEAGGYPEDMPEDVATYLEPDGGLLSTLDLAVRLLEDRERALPLFREIVQPLP